MKLSSIYKPSVLLAILCLFCTTLLNGQTACFSIAPAQACTGETVTYSNCSLSPAGQLSTGDGTLLQLDATVPSATHSYSTSGSFNVFQVVQSGAGNDISPTQTVQVVSNTIAPGFTVNSCAGNLVNVTITDSNYDNYLVNWGDGNTSVGAPAGTVSHTYSATSNYTITVTGRFNTASCTSPPATQNVTTLNSLIAPIIQDLTVNTQSLNGSTTLRFFALPTQQYQIVEQQGGGAPINKTTVQFQNGLQTLTFNNIPTSIDPFYYRIYAYDNCGSPVSYSDDVYSAVLSGTATNNQNNLSWFDYNSFLVSNFDHYDLYKDGTLLAGGLTTSTYTDNAVTCQQTYNYQIRTFTTTGQIAYSAFIPVTAISTTTPSTLVNPNVSVVNGQTLVVWDAPTGFTPSSYEIQRSDNGAAFTTVGNISAATPQFTDASSNPTSSGMCYQIRYTDVCTNAANYSLRTCPVLLSVTTTDTDNILNWTSYTGYYVSGVQSYEVEVLDGAGSVIRVISGGAGFTLTDAIDPAASVMRYRIRVVANGTENLLSYSNIVEVSFSTQVHVPTAFSPNQDGQNDLFLVKGRYINNYEMTIFNQWGQTIYFSNDLTKGWDGNFNGTPCTTDDYIWLLKGTDNAGAAFSQKGSVTLLR